MSEKHSRYAEGLRQMADWIEQHPEIPVPSTEIVNYAVDGKEMAAKVLVQAAPCQKRYDGSIFSIVKEFGPIELRHDFIRGQVCTRKVVGTKEVPAYFIPARTEEIVEWDCHPILDRDV